MDSKYLFSYKAQLINQLEYAKIATSQIQQNTKMNASYVFFFIQSLLVSLSNIAKLFEGDSKNNSKTQRALELCRIFDIDLSDFPIIGEKSLRNTNEHFDERIDSFIKKAKEEDKSFADCCVGTISEKGENAGFCNPKTIYMRHYDNVNKNIRYVGKDLNQVYKINIDELLEELNRLENKIVNQVQNEI